MTDKPLVNYKNRTALKLFEVTYHTSIDSFKKKVLMPLRVQDLGFMKIKYEPHQRSNWNSFDMREVEKFK